MDNEERAEHMQAAKCRMEVVARPHPHKQHRMEYRASVVLQSDGVELLGTDWTDDRDEACQLGWLLWDSLVESATAEFDAEDAAVAADPSVGRDDHGR